jgi:hypothetical protein
MFERKPRSMKADHEVGSRASWSGPGDPGRGTEHRSGVAKTSAFAVQYRVAFGRNFHQARVDANLTLEAVVAMTGLSAVRILGIEAGDCDPRLNEMALLASVVDREVWTLLPLPDSGGE